MRHIDFARVGVGDIIRLLMILGMMYAGWLRFDQRLTAAEIKIAENQQIIERQSSTLTNLDRTLELLSQRLMDYPLHKHIPGDGIDYPGVIR